MRKTIAIIGAGPGGLAAARHCLAAGHVVSVFEQTDRLGGAWAYRETNNNNNNLDSDLALTSTVYDDLITNLPKEVMGYPDVPMCPDHPESFIPAADVLAYFESFADRFNVRPFIFFKHEVLVVRPLANDATQKNVCKYLNWEIIVRRLDTGLSGEPTGRIERYRYDAVFVANGHYTVPRVPSYPDVDRYTGNLQHSHTYRSGKTYAKRSVLIIGAGPSGLDLIRLIEPHAERIALSHRQTLPPGLTQGLQLRPAVAGFTENGVRFVDGLEETYSDVILCTGFKYSYPFLSADCDIRLHEDGNVVRSLFKECINIERPSMFLLGIQFNDIGIQLMDLQVRFCLAFLNGSRTLPGREEMLAITAEDLRQRLQVYEGEVRYTHKLGAFQTHYLKELAELGGLEPVRPVVLRIFEQSLQYLGANGFQRYRQQRFRVLNDNEFQRTV